MAGKGYITWLTRARRWRHREHPNYNSKKKARETFAQSEVAHDYTLLVTFGIHGTCTTVRRKKRGKRLRNFRLRMRTQSLPDRANSGNVNGHVTDATFGGPTTAAIAQLPVAHAQNILPVRALPVTWLTSLPVTWLPVVPPRIFSANMAWAVPIYYSYRLGKFFVSRLVCFANTPLEHDISVQNPSYRDSNEVTSTFIW